MKRIMTLYAQATIIIPNFLPGGYVDRRIAMFTYLTPGTNRVFSKCYSTKEKAYSEEMRVIYTNFIKALLYNRLNLDAKRFKKRDDIIKFLENFQGDVLFTRHQISMLKNKGEFERIPLTPKSKEFINYVKKEFPDFDGFEFALVAPIIVQNKEIVNKVEPKVEPKIDKAEPVVKVETKIQPTVVKIKDVVTETSTTKVTKSEPTIVINNANLAQATATTATITKTKSSYGNLFWRILLLDDYHEGITFLLIQLPYLVLFLLTFKDNPEIMKYLTDNFGIEEYKAPSIISNTELASTELVPIEYDFTVDFYEEDSNINATPEIDLNPTDQEETSRDYADNSNVEYFDYFDYYHSKPKPEAIKDNPEPIKPIKELEYVKSKVEDVKSKVESSLLNNTKHASDYLSDKLKTISTGVAEGKQAIEDKVSTIVTHGSNSIKDKVIKLNDNHFMKSTQSSKPLVDLDKEVHFIDDQFSGSIDVYSQEDLQSLQSSKPKKVTTFATNGKSTWWFPMLDFNNLNYYPSLFEKFNTNPTNNISVAKITDKVDYMKAFANQLQHALELYNSSRPVSLNKSVDTIKIDVATTVTESEVKGKEIQNLPNINTRIDPDTLAALEGRIWNNPRTSDSSSDKFSTYFYYADKPNANPNEALIELNKSKRITQIMVNHSDIAMDIASSSKRITQIMVNPVDFSDIENNYDALIVSFEDRLNEIFDYKDEFNKVLEKFNDSKGANSKTKAIEPMPLSPTSEYFSKPDDFFKEEAFNDFTTVAQNYIENKRKIEKIDKLVVDLKAQLINFTTKIEDLDKIISDFRAISKFDGRMYKFSGDISKLDYTRFNAIRNKLQYLDEFKYYLIDEFNLKNDNINILIAKRDALTELCESYRSRNSLKLKDILKIN